MKFQIQTENRELTVLIIRKILKEIFPEQSIYKYKNNKSN